MKNKVILTKDNIKILVVCHKLCELPPNSDELFLPIQVGCAVNDFDLGLQRDDVINGTMCDNISTKNNSFCELTALYWAWKNIKKNYPNLEYIGLNHYRRYFSFNKRNFFSDDIILPENEIRNYKLDKVKLEKILSKNDILISKPHVFEYSLEVEYSVKQISEDLRTLKRIIHEKYSEYDQDVYEVLTCNNKLSCCNMTIMKWNDFNSYCTWLFNILFAAEKEINITNYNEVQKRIFGYMAERLLNVWIHHNLKKIKQLNIIKYNNEDYLSQNKKNVKLKNFLKFCKRKLSAKIFLAFKRPYSKEYYRILNKFN